ncbi:GNAT family N-acetyltransferase [Ktedonobacter racemifer]|uniref:GCN5-related N-acetyltransferase n=1 Tax=Ktedonobacter racemifer DSM 44963 TaxID=485913 RepID=D6THP7_KTERA|nr:GNAT family protein [Ktedonobacter racemifer]EFH89052.1 GCN5-related N-acetyltransferase [Ktedonobacter racemifer DSM 44963]
MQFTNNSHGPTIRLRAVEPEDWEILYQRWGRDVEGDRMTDMVWFPMTREQVRAWAEKESKRGAEEDNFRFQIETLNGELVGTINTHECDARCGTFYYGVFIEAQHRRKGYAEEALALVLRYFFEERRYQKVNAEVFGFNEVSQRFHERFGFTLEGRLRRMIYTGGRHWDTLVYGMTAEEFAEKYR